MKNCVLFQDDLKAYADGELSPLRRLLVRRHLTHCASCRKEIAEMTQVTEELRAAEPEDALSPTLREKLLEPGTGSAGLLGESHSMTEESSVAERLSLNSSPALPVPGSRRKRPIPAWTFAALAVVAWFICYPAFTKLRYTQQAQMTSPTAAVVHERQIKVIKPLPQETASAPVPLDEPMSAERPSPPSMSVTGGGVPLSAIVPPPPPKPKMMARLSAPEAPTGGRVVYSTFGTEHLNANSINGVASDLNGDPDSLRQVHKEASIGLQVPNPDATGDTVNSMVRETGGYVAANNLSTEPDGRKSGELIVKVPETQFETFLAAVAKLGTVVSKNITGEDITEKTSDAGEAQSVEEGDLEKSEARLKALGSHAKWEDQENTRDLRVQLAQTRARLKLLKRMAALGTITIDLSQTPKAAAAVPVTNGFTGTLKATTHDALQSLVGSASALLALGIWLLAYAPIWVPLLFLGRYALKEYRRREAV